MPPRLWTCLLLTVVKFTNILNLLAIKFHIASIPSEDVQKAQLLREGAGTPSRTGRLAQCTKPARLASVVKPQRMSHFSGALNAPSCHIRDCEVDLEDVEIEGHCSPVQEMRLLCWTSLSFTLPTNMQQGSVVTDMPSSYKIIGLGHSGLKESCRKPF